MTDTNITTSERPIERRFDPGRAGAPHQSFLRQFSLPDGRPILIDKRAVAFIVAAKDAPDKQTVIAFRAGAAKPCPVRCPYDEVKAWWYGTTDKPAANGKAA
jgi:hypothetical protein